MLRIASQIISLLAVLFSVAALAGGSNYRVAPGARIISGKITEWVVPTRQYPRDPVVATDGSIYFALREGDRIARFDPKTQQFKEWRLRDGFRPNGVRIARDGKILFTGLGYGVIGELDPASGTVHEYATTAQISHPYTIILDPNGSSVWFTERTTGNVVKLDRPSGKLKSYKVGKDVYGLAIDARGDVWVSRLKDDKLTKLDPNTGRHTDIELPLGSIPRRLAISADGMLWVTYYGAGKLAKVDTVTNRILKVYILPGGPSSGPYAVNADAAGRIWVSEIQTDNIDVLDPRSETFQVFKLPSKGSGVRKAAIDTEGRYWYCASHSGKLGMIE